MSSFVGRAASRARLTAAYRAAVTAAAGPVPGRPGLVLLVGEAGIGKTALLTEFAADAAAAGATVLWGTSWDDDQAPAWWPWTQAFRTLLRQHAGLRADAPADLAAVVPDLVGAPPGPSGGNGEGGRLRIFDAVGQTLGRAGTHAPVVVILDDLQWADASTLGLLRFVARQPLPGAVVLVGAYRPGEARGDVAAGLADLAAAAELITLQGLGRDEIADLVRTLSGTSAAGRWAALVHERTNGHPFFARELCRLLTAGGADDEVPAAVREVIGRRLARLPDGCSALLAAAAVAGNHLLPDVLAEVCGDPAAVVADRIDAVTAAGVVVSGRPAAGTARFAHDLFRETVYTGLPTARRLDLHARVARALLLRHERGAPVFPAELARHFAAALPVAGPAPALAWAYAAADADRARYAFAEAAGQLTRLRAAAAAAGAQLGDPELIGVLTTEADLRLRSGDAAAARSLLDMAWERARRTGDADLLARVALGMDRVGARFAMPRTDLVTALDTARRAVAGRGTAAEAEV
ncbi:MAG TPA: AAA family ATPase, partial [Actinoplanes sp.]|nr:AAA family ATPase [Actinoplanes sp.]